MGRSNVYGSEELAGFSACGKIPKGAMEDKELTYRLREVAHGWRWEVRAGDVIVVHGIERNSLSARVAAFRAAMDFLEPDPVEH